jgi:hypothetical protein
MISLEVSIILALTLVRQLVLLWAPQAVFSAYLYMFALALVISYCILQDVKSSLTVSILLIFGMIIYRHNTKTTETSDTVAFTLGVSTVFALSAALKPYTKSMAIDFTLYGSALYLVMSLTEWLVHKYVMHCYQKAPWLLSLPDNVLTRTCIGHRNHHLSVKPDMSLDNTVEDEQLIFSWAEIIPLSIVIFMFMGGIAHFLKLRINIYGNAAMCIGASVLHATVWNSIHTDMHNHDITTQLPDVNVPHIFFREWTRNHTLHHQIKSEKKGNYNVVFLGVDELFESNNKILE